MEKQKFTSGGRDLYLDSRFEEVSGRHLVTELRRDYHTDEILFESTPELRDLFSKDEEIDADLVQQEASSIFLSKGVAPKMVIVGFDDYLDLCRRLMVNVSLPGGRKPGINVIESIVTTVGTIQVVADPDVSKRRTYICDNKTTVKDGVGAC